VTLPHNLLIVQTFWKRRLCKGKRERLLNSAYVNSPGMKVGLGLNEESTRQLRGRERVDYLITENNLCPTGKRGSKLPGLVRIRLTEPAQENLKSEGAELTNPEHPESGLILFEGDGRKEKESLDPHPPFILEKGRAKKNWEKKDGGNEQDI